MSSPSDVSDRRVGLTNEAVIVERDCAEYYDGRDRAEAAGLTKEAARVVRMFTKDMTGLEYTGSNIMISVLTH